ncbi:MAG: phenylalanine--tRNA ligase subunit alpha [Clostridiales bacterium]|nr:MAG: phenylalanine--tRNA ligase subunit alpha [Clostridiales bacterium]
MLKEKLQQARENAAAELEKIKTSEELETLRVSFLGKKGKITSLLSEMGKLSAEERPVIGQVANEVRSYIDAQIKQKKEELAQKELEFRLKKEKVDITLPGKPVKVGRQHPLHLVLDEVKDAFISMGFTIEIGPEVEFDKYNFEKLNIPADHPARDTQDTFYFTPEVLLRTQTSSVQVRVMENKKPPIRILSPGRVYRIDEIDATHSPVFHQIEGLVVDEGITMAHLKGALETMAKKLFGENVKTRIRPDYFPFTEPSAEICVSCFRCGGEGCRFCKGEGWIEIGGAGMVNPKVLESCGIDTQKYSGFAFGMGLERLVMLRYKIDDIRMFFENDVRFLNNF